MAVAWLALVVSLGTFAWTVFWSIRQERSRTRPRLSVQIGTSRPNDPAAKEVMVGVIVTNSGFVPIAVKAVVFRAKGREDGVFVGPSWVQQRPGGLPLTLEPGEQWYGLVEMRRLVNQLRSHNVRQVSAIALDPSDRQYRAATRPKLLSRRPWRSRWLTLPEPESGDRQTQNGVPGRRDPLL